MPQPDLSKFSHLKLDESRGDLDRPLPPLITTSETATPLELTTTLPFSTPFASSSADSFPVVIGMPSTTQYVAATLQVVVTENLFGALLSMPASLPMSMEDSLMFSFKAASGVKGDLAEDLSSGFAPTSFREIESPASSRIPCSANSLLQQLTPHDHGTRMGS